MKIISKFDYSHVLFSKKNTLNLLVQAAAPKVALQESRKPINLITAIDTSGSMAGDKIEYAKKSLLKLIDHLGAQDTLGVIEFTDYVRVVTTPLKMTSDNKSKLKSEVMSLTSQSSTNFSGALYKAIELAKEVDGNCRIIMFTDGQPTSGVTDLKQILGALDGMFKKGISISSFGYGLDHDSTFLTEISKFGDGNYAYVQNPDDALKAFAIELGGLLSCYGQELKFTITPKGGVKIKEVVSDLDVEEKGDSVVVSVADIYSEETKNIVVEVEVSEQESVFPRAVTLLDVTLSYLDTVKGERCKVDSKAKVHFTKNEMSDVDKDVAGQLALARLVQAQTQAVKFANLGDMVSAQSAIQAAGVYFTNNLDDNIIGLQATTQSYFASSDSYRNHAHDVSQMKYSLRNNRMTGSSASNLSLNSVQQNIVNSFVKKEADVDDVSVTFSIADKKVSKTKSKKEW